MIHVLEFDGICCAKFGLLSHDKSCLLSLEKNKLPSLEKKMAYLHHGNLQCALVSPGKLDCHWRYLASFLLRKLARFLCENLALSLRKFGLLSVEIGLLSVEKFVWLSQWRLGLLSVEKLGFCLLGNLSSHSTVYHAVITKFCVWLRAGSQADDPAHCAVIQ